MIDIKDAKEGLTVYYGNAEYGMITSVNTKYVFVRFGFDTGSKACDPATLHWPPIFAKTDMAEPGQKYQENWT